MIPKKPAPHLMRDGNRFSEKIMLHERLEQDNDSNKSLPALLPKQLANACPVVGRMFFAACAALSVGDVCIGSRIIRRVHQRDYRRSDRYRFEPAMAWFDFCLFLRRLFGR